MRRRPRQAAGDHRRQPLPVASHAGLPTRSPSPAASGFGGRPEQAAFPVTRETSDPPVPQDREHPGAPRPRGPARPATSRRTGKSAASAARQDQRPPSGPCGAETSRNCQTSGLPRVPCLEPAGPPLSPYRPRCPRAGCGHCRAGPAPVLTWLASPCRTGDGPDLLPNRLPGAAGCRLCVCSTACYGLTPRCREVKR